MSIYIPKQRIHDGLSTHINLRKLELMNSGRLLYETEGKPAVQLPLSPKYILKLHGQKESTSKRG